ncbi:MAG: glutathione S-transferase family protein [Paracoccaceae bacterium]|nr:glutathione S-transferase family protein [Paracoccaceae bacterium]
MKLYSNAASPFARKVRVVILETGQGDSVDLVEVFGTTVDPGTMPIDKNPLGRLPVLEAEGQAIYDSRVICRYLIAQAAAPLYGSDSDQWRILTLEASGDGIMDSALGIVYEKRVRPEGMHYAPVMEGHWSKIERMLGGLDRNWLDLLEAPLNIGQISVACALGYLDFRLSDRDWRSANPKLSAWYESFSARDSMKATVPPAA